MRHLAAVITSKYLMCHVTATALSSAMAAMVVKATQDMVLVIICVEMQTGSTTCRPVTAKLLTICMSGATIPVRHILHISIPEKEKKTRFQEMKKEGKCINWCLETEYMSTFVNYIELAKLLNIYSEFLQQIRRDTVCVVRLLFVPAKYRTWFVDMHAYIYKYVNMIMLSRQLQYFSFNNYVQNVTDTFYDYELTLNLPPIILRSSLLLSIIRRPQLVIENVTQDTKNAMLNLLSGPGLLHQTKSSFTTPSLLLVFV